MLYVMRCSYLNISDEINFEGIGLVVFLWRGPPPSVTTSLLDINESLQFAYFAAITTAQTSKTVHRGNDDIQKMVQASKYYQFEVKGNIWKWLNVKASDGNKRYIILFHIYISTPLL